MFTQGAHSLILIHDDDDIYYYTCWRLKLEGETENMCVCTKERKGVAAEVLMARRCVCITKTEKSRRPLPAKKKVSGYTND